MRWLAAMLLCLLPVAALAQDDDRGTLTAFLEDNLSDAGRQVTVTGFAGALSSRATIERLTIADTEGIWLTLEGVVLDWNRLALLSGRVEVNALTADAVVLARAPVAPPDAVPAPEASGFSLPDLPVSVNIGRIASPRVELGPTVLGQPVAGSLVASLVLDGGEGRAEVAIERQDAGPEGSLRLTASYSNASGQLLVSLDAAEAPGGIAATLLNLPGVPDVRLQVQGAGPVTNFAADLRLATGGVDRVAGRVTLRETLPGVGSFAANLSGDVAPLFLPDYADFFGPKVSLVVNGQRTDAGRLELDRLSLQARALQLDGTLALAADGLPARFALTARVGADGAPVLLPLGGGPRTAITTADLTLAYDAARGEGWRLAGHVTGIDRPDLTLGRLTLDGSGRIARRAGQAASLGGNLRFGAEGIAPADPALATALGPALRGAATFSWLQGDGELRIGNLAVSGGDYAASARGRVDGLASGYRLTGTAGLQAADLSRFAALARRPLSGRAEVSATGQGSPLGGTFDVTATVASTDLTVGQREADNLLRGPARIEASVLRGTGGLILRQLEVVAGGAVLSASGTLATAGSDLTATLEAADLGVLGGAYGGALAAEAGFSGTPEAGRITLKGNARDLTTGEARLDGLLRGPTALDLGLAFAGARVTVERAVVANPQASVDARGVYDPAGSDLAVNARVPSLGVLGAGFGGALSAEARLTGSAADGTLVASGEGRDLTLGQPQADALLAGSSRLAVRLGIAGQRIRIDEARIGNAQLTAAATGSYDPAGSDLRLTAALPRLAVLGAGYGGALSLTAALTGTPEAGRIAVDGQGRDLTLGQTQADRLFRGDSALTFRAALEDGRLQVETARLATPQVTAEATGTVTEEERRVALSARLANLALLVPEFPGPLSLQGTLAERGGDYAVDIRATGPGGIDARTQGTLARSFGSGALSITGTAQAALANAFLGARAISGDLGFDLRLNGPLAVASLSGPVRLTGGRFSDPSLPFGLEPVAATTTLSGGAVTITADAGVSTGGQVGVTGRVGLDAPYAGDLALRLQGVVLRDPDLYATTAEGALTVSGPLAGGALIAGRVRLGDTELRVPSSGLGGNADLPGLRHANEPPPVRETRARAGLLEKAAAAGRGSARPFALDLVISAPNRVFVRGRGLDAELGGRIELGGTTANVIAAGGMQLVRGRLDILGKRLTLDRATLDLQGDLVPYLDVAASNVSEGVTSTVLISGRADAPVVSFTSSPSLPEEEVLSRLLFGRGLQNISALQAAQLAGAVATLAGRGGDGIVGRLRKGFGLDDLDVATDEAGETSLRAGKYLSRNLYTQVEVGQDGKAGVNLNLDVRRGVTVRGRVGSDGSAGIGVFVERDY